jgi:hypothetical protein
VICSINMVCDLEKESAMHHVYSFVFVELFICSFHYVRLWIITSQRWMCALVGVEVSMTKMHT